MADFSGLRIDGTWGGNLNYRPRLYVVSTTLEWFDEFCRRNEAIIDRSSTLYVSVTKLGQHLAGVRGATIVIDGNIQTPDVLSVVQNHAAMDSAVLPEAEWKRRFELVMYVVYDHPRDFPDNFVVRKWVQTPGELRAEEHAHLYATLYEARIAKPEGMVTLDRNENDDPTIVEVWI